MIELILSPPEDHLTLPKLKMVRTVVTRYQKELELLQKEDRSEEEGLNLVEMLGNEHFGGVVQWLNQHLEVMLDVEEG